MQFKQKKMNRKEYGNESASGRLDGHSVVRIDERSTLQMLLAASF